MLIGVIFTSSCSLFFCFVFGNDTVKLVSIQYKIEKKNVYDYYVGRIGVSVFVVSYAVTQRLEVVKKIWN